MRDAVRGRARRQGFALAAIQVIPLDPLSFLAAPFMLLAAARVASLAPALRAGSVDPSRVLRQN